MVRREGRIKWIRKCLGVVIGDIGMFLNRIYDWESRK